MIDEKWMQEQEMERLESELKGQKSRVLLGKIIKAVGTIMAVGCFMIGMIPMALVGALIIFIGGKIQDSGSTTIKKQLGNHLIRGVLEEVFQNVTYDPFGHIPWNYVKESYMMFPFQIDNIQGSDYVKGTYKGLQVELSDLTFLEEVPDMDEETGIQRTNEREVFKGQWLVCDFGKELSAEVQLATRTRFERLMKTATIKTENEEFNKKFSVRSAVEEEAFYILTPHMQEYILQMAGKAGGNVYMSFLRNGKLHLAVGTGRDSFELGKSKVDAEQLRQKFVGELRWFTDLIDELQLVDTLYKEGE